MALQFLHHEADLGQIALAGRLVQIFAQRLAQRVRAFPDGFSQLRQRIEPECRSACRAVGKEFPLKGYDFIDRLFHNPLISNFSRPHDSGRIYPDNAQPAREGSPIRHGEDSSGPSDRRPFLLSTRIGPSRNRRNPVRFRHGNASDFPGDIFRLRPADLVDPDPHAGHLASRLEDGIGRDTAHPNTETVAFHRDEVPVQVDLPRPAKNGRSRINAACSARNAEPPSTGNKRSTRPSGRRRTNRPCRTC